MRTEERTNTREVRVKEVKEDKNKQEMEGQTSINHIAGKRRLVGGEEWTNQIEGGTD